MRMTCTILLLATVASAQYAAVLPEDHLKMLQVNGDGKMMKAGPLLPLPGFWMSDTTGIIYHVKGEDDGGTGECWHAIAHSCRTCSPEKLQETIEGPAPWEYSGMATAKYDRHFGEADHSYSQRAARLKNYADEVYATKTLPIQKLGDLFSLMRDPSLPIELSDNEWDKTTSFCWTERPLCGKSPVIDSMTQELSPGVIITATKEGLKAKGYFIPDVSDVSPRSALQMKNIINEDAHRFRLSKKYGVKNKNPDYKKTTIWKDGYKAKRLKETHEAFGYEKEEAQVQIHQDPSPILHFTFYKNRFDFREARTDTWRRCSDESCEQQGASQENALGMKTLREWRGKDTVTDLRGEENPEFRRVRDLEYC